VVEKWGGPIPQEKGGFNLGIGPSDNHSSYEKRRPRKGGKMQYKKYRKNKRRYRRGKKALKKKKKHQTARLRI